MVKRIRPVTRIAKFESGIRRLMNEAMTERPDFPDLQGAWLPLVDVYEKDDALVVEVEVPGLTAREIIVSLRVSRIEIQGLKMESPVKKGARYLRLEREYGKFQRTVPLPCAVDPDGAKAFLENGILTVYLKKPKASRERDIIVKIQKNEE